jgi:hypothetical protein
MATGTKAEGTKKFQIEECSSQNFFTLNSALVTRHSALPAMLMADSCYETGIRQGKNPTIRLLI